MAPRNAGAVVEKVEKTEDEGIFAGMEVEEEVKLPLRGRGYTPEVMRIREELEKCLKDGTARSFPNVTDENREDFARKIRSAGKMNPEIKITTRLDKAHGKLIWGPAEVLDKLTGKTPAGSDSDAEAS